MPLSADLRQQLGITGDFGESGSYAPTRTPPPEPTGAFGKTIDFLSRGLYASTTFFDSIVSEPGMAVGSALAKAGDELTHPTQRLLFADLIRKHAPGFADRNPTSTAVLGFIGDVAGDPLTYATLGSGAGAKYAVTNVPRSTKGIGSLVARFAEGGVADGPKLSRLVKTGLEDVGTYGSKARDAIISAGHATTAVEGTKHVRLSRAGAKYADELGVQLRNRAVLTKEGMDVRNLRIKALMDNRGVSKADAAKLVDNQLMRALGEKSAWFDSSWYRHLDAFEAQNLVDIRIRQVLAKSEELGEASKYVQKPGLRIAGALVPGSNAAWKAVSTAVGYTGLGKRLKSLTTPLRRIVGRNADIPPEMTELARWLQRDLAMGEQQMHKTYERLFKDFTAKDRELMAKAGFKIEEDTYKLAKAEGKPLEKRMAAQETINSVMDEFGLNETQRTMMAELQNEFRHFGRVEKDAGLVTHIFENYFPRAYDATKSAGELKALRGAVRTDVPIFHSPGMTRTYETIEMAKEAGLDVIMDAGVLYAARAGAHYKNLSRRMFADGVKRFFPTIDYKINDVGEWVFKKGDTAGNLARNKAKRGTKRHIEDHIRFIGDGLYDSVADGGINDIFKKYDRAMSLFRASATVARPAFGVRQVFSNMFQAYLRNGIRSLDPRGFVDALHLLSGRTDFRITNTFGRSIPGADMMSGVNEFQIVRNVAIDGVGHKPSFDTESAKRLVKTFDKERAIRGLTGKSLAGGSNMSAKGMGYLLAKVGNYTNVPAMIEDIGRLTMFANSVRYGNSYRTAAKHVEEGMFDYLGGLSRYEQRYARRLIPFYSYQRFAAPLVARATVQTPGRVTNSLKAGRTLMEVYGKMFQTFSDGPSNDTTLTDGERRVLPGWLIDQPHEFLGFDKDMEARFGRFNNFMPLDIMGFMRMSDDGKKLDMRKSLINLSLAQLTPVIKVPMELLLKQDFFTGQSLERARRLGDVDAEKLVAGMAAAAVATTMPGGNTAGHMAGVGALAAIAAGTNKPVPEVVLRGFKAAMGWEETIDSRTGKRQVFVSPYRIHILASAFPGLQDAVKYARDDRSPVERNMQLLFGVGMTKLDLGEQRKFRVKDLKREKQEKESEIRLLKMQGRAESARKAQVDLREWLADYAADMSKLSGLGPIRGRQPGANPGDVGIEQPPVQ